MRCSGLQAIAIRAPCSDSRKAGCSRCQQRGCDSRLAPACLLICNLKDWRFCAYGNCHGWRRIDQMRLAFRRSMVMDPACADANGCRCSSHTLGAVTRASVAAPANRFRQTGADAPAGGRVAIRAVAAVPSRARAKLAPTFLVLLRPISHVY